MTVKFLHTEEIQAGNLWRFPGGVHPPERKSIANSSPIQRMPIPKRLILPFKQHIGQAGIPLVAEGDTVVKGQPLTEPGPNAGLIIHAPTSGYIKTIGDYRSAHPSALSVPAFELIPDGLDIWGQRHPITDYSTHSSAELLAHISACGIAGLGGAGFPTAQKLAAQGKLDYLIINGAECEPYIVSDDRLMREHAAGIIRGTRILLHIAGLQKALIAVEDNKPEAIRALRDACGKDEHLAVRVIPTQYPSGGERQLIQILTGRQVPSGSLPMDVGLLMQNVGTAYAIYRAVVFGEPLLERVITVTGEALERPGTVWTLLGTTVEELLQFCGYQSYPKARVIMGGPMMGFTLPTLDVPVIKGSNCILAPARKELPQPGSEMACIRCGACADVCPASLLPQQLYWLARAKDADGLRQHNLADCIECGACAYVCPSEIPLVHYYRQAKAELREQYIEKQKAEVARQRFEARQARLEREKEERLERHQRAAEARKKAQQERQAQSSDDSVPQDPVKAAVARAKAKKAAQNKNTDATVDDKKVDDKKDKVAAAVARAKAKKQAEAQKKQQSSISNPDNESN
ncbi:electron transport complex subunit RsxC [Aliidiomarina minuta]|uniref:Ion-translocating oxidoreductase complex subunit C n=1 Tax=Aliidiomarina minuta TaxID=880057 RepID=A0A432W7T7_9GAMM|nr:electron transport complex subunit RsxC [Aliidiomarina minuta]RUO26157.1 electron transport complex subunit RsxC [Aliidiomarina minuta]